MNYTSIEQVKHLLELGLNSSTADMFYPWHIADEEDTFEDGYLLDTPMIGKYGSRGTIPCWSLTALLELMPPYLFEWERGIDLNIYRNLNGKGWHVSYMPNNINDMQKDKFRQITNGDTLMDAAYNMVCWLVEQGFIKK